jgi:hypothetical protein
LECALFHPGVVRCAGAFFKALAVRASQKEIYMKALSIRQPWAWLIVNGYKTIENRETNLGNYFGPLLIHASKTMTNEDYAACLLYLISHGHRRIAELLQDQHSELPRGGIVGAVEIVAKLTKVPHDHLNQKIASWYTGDVGYILETAKVPEFQSCKGRLGFFEVAYEE